MNKPYVYLKGGIQPESDFKHVSSKYLNKLKFKEYCNVMDIGCGPGNITNNGLLPLLPKTLNALIGVDISPQMVKYAKENYQTDPKISFCEFDVLTDNIPTKYCETFDHIYSGFCLHFIKDQRKALKNIHAMLKPGGNIFVYFLAKNITFEVYECLEAKDKWKPYLINYKQEVTPTQFCNNPEHYFKNVLEETNFSINYIVSEERSIMHSKQSYIDNFTSIKYSEIPDRLCGDFIAEFFDFAASRNLINRKEDGEEQIHYPYTLFIVHATKANF